MKYVYFARSIRGEHGEDDETIHEAIIAAIRAADWNTQFEIGLSNVTRERYKTDEEYIYQRDMEWLRQCDAVIAEVSHPSHGVGYEIAYAEHGLFLPILLLAARGTRLSAMLTGSPDNLQVYTYKDIVDMCIGIKAFLEANND